MRTIAALTALLVCAGAWAQDAEEPAEAVKVLGFTFGEPPPEDAVLLGDAGRYRRYDLKHRWCKSLFAITDNGRVVSVNCFPNDPVAMLSLLKSRYGPPQESGGISTWFTPYGTAIITETDGLDVVLWVRAAIYDEIFAARRAHEQAVLALMHATEAAIDAKIAELENAEGEDF